MSGFDLKDVDVASMRTAKLRDGRYMLGGEVIATGSASDGFATGPTVTIKVHTEIGEEHTVQQAEKALLAAAYAALCSLAEMSLSALEDQQSASLLDAAIMALPEPQIIAGKPVYDPR